MLFREQQCLDTGLLICSSLRWNRISPDDFLNLLQLYHLIIVWYHLQKFFIVRTYHFYKVLQYKFKLTFSQCKGLQNEGDSITLNHLENLFLVMPVPAVHSSEVHIIQECVCPQPITIILCGPLYTFEVGKRFVPQLPSTK